MSLVSPTDEAGRVGVDDEGGQAVATLRRIGQRVDDRDARLAAARDESLVAVQHEMRRRRRTAVVRIAPASEPANGSANA